MKLWQLLETLRLGGPGSGHWGHAGRKGSGKRGGSLPRAGGLSLKTGKDWRERQRKAAGKFGTSRESSIRKLGKKEAGVCDSVIMEFPDGTKGIFKSEVGMEYGSVEGEILAYEFSESVGWGIVPETVMFESSGKSGSLQRWVDGCEMAGLKYNSWIPEDEKHLTDRGEQMVFMDLLFDNHDRHGGNWLVESGSDKVWAIDNGGFFGIKGHWGGNKQSYEYHPSVQGLRAYQGTRIGKDFVTWAKSPKRYEYSARIRQLMDNETADRFDRAVEGFVRLSAGQ